MKASDIADTAVLELLASPPNVLGWNRWDLAARFPDYPEKVVTAKVRQLAKRGLVRGCFCGCRGDFRLAPHT